MKEKLSRKIIMLTLICVLTLLDIFMVSIQLVQAEESKQIHADVKIEGVLNKYINYNFSEENIGTLVEYDVGVGINYGEDQERYSIKENMVYINLGKIEEKYPNVVKVIGKSTKMTNGQQTNEEEDYQYDAETGVLTIKQNNQDESGNLKYDYRPSEQDKDEYKIICYYDTYTTEKPERKLASKISVNISLLNDDNSVISNTENFETVVAEDIGEITSINTYTEEIYNGYMKSNVINGTEYNTQYSETKEITISKKDAQDKIKVTEENTFIRENENTNGEKSEINLENRGNLVYKSTKIRKDDIINILGEDGQLQVLDTNENVIATIDKNTEFAEDGTFTISYAEGIENIIIKTSDVIDEGILHIDNIKEIRNELQDIDNIRIKTVTNIEGVIEKLTDGQETEDSEVLGETKETTTQNTYNYKTDNIIEIKDSKNNVSIDVNNTEWTNKQQNEVTFDVYLDSSDKKYNMYKNPSFKIELPSQVEKVILGNSSIIYGNGLELGNVFVETDTDGTLNIVVELNGEQKYYYENNLGLITNINIGAILILKKDVENSVENLNVMYSNNFTLDGKIETGVASKEIKIISYNQEEEQVDFKEIIDYAKSSENVVTKENIEGLKLEVIPVRGDDNLDNGDTVYEGEFIKYNIKLTNTSDTDIKDVKIVADLPEGITYGELEADYVNRMGKYQYNFNNSLREKTIDVGTIEAGKSNELFYEVRVNDLNNEEQKEIVSSIKVLAGDIEGAKYEINNIVKPSDAKVFLAAHPSGYKYKWMYEVIVNGNSSDSMLLEFKAPESFKLEGVYLKEGKVEGVSVSKDNVISWDAKPGTYYVQGMVDGKTVTSQTDVGVVELDSIAVITTNGNKYKSNENRIIHEFPNVKISMYSPTEGEEVKYGEEIEYRIKVEAIGRCNAENDPFQAISVDLTDYLPDDVIPVSIEYDNWREVIDESTAEKDKEGNIEAYQSTGEFEKIHYEETLYGNSVDEDGNRVPNVDLLLIMPYGESTEIIVKTTAGLVYEKTTIENTANLVGEEIALKTTNKIRHIILPFNYTEPGDPEEPTDPEEPEEPTDPEDPDNPDNPEEPEPPNPSEGKKHNISGVAWIDSNEDGQRQPGENTLNGITVMLVDMKNSGSVKSKMQTTSKGEYKFSDLDEGEYIVIFKYDTNNYNVTDYRKTGVAESVNSDVSNQEITLQGERITVAVTDVLNLSNDIKNLDIGLKENKVFDLKLDKRISKVTVQTNKQTTIHSYNDVELAKVDIRAQEIEGAQVTVEYKIVVTNEGDISGTIGNVVDYLPDGFELTSNSNRNWTKQKDNEFVNLAMANREIGAGESVTLTLIANRVLTSEELGTYTNKAEIGDASNVRNIADSDSKPGNSSETEDDFSKAQLIVSIGTGAIVIYVSIFFGIAIIIGIGICLIKKYGVSKTMRNLTLLVIALCTTFFVNTNEVSAAQAPSSLSFYWCTSGGYQGTYPNGIWLCGHGYNNIYGSYHFTGGYLGTGGFCYQPGPDAYNGTYSFSYYESASATGTSIEYTIYNGSGYTSLGSSKPSDIISANESSQIGAKILGENVIYGPFTINANMSGYGGGYSFSVLDSVGNAVQNVTTTDENGEEITVRGTATFYLKIPLNNCQNGISAITASTIANALGTTTYTHYSSRAVYTPGSLQNVVTDYTFIYDTKTSTTYEKDSVTWTSFTGILEVVKKDADDYNVNLPGVEIKVANSSGQIIKTGTTDSNGRVYFDNLPAGTYTILEGKNDIYGYTATISKVLTTSSGELRTFILPNEKQTGNLRIEKRDADTGKVMENVSFIVREKTSSSYIVAMENQNTESGEVLTALDTVVGTKYLDGMTTTENRDEATVFKTDSEGLVQIYNILTGEYIIEEIDIGDNNYGYDIDDNYISWDINGKIIEGKSAIVTVERQRSYNTVEDSTVVTDTEKTIEDGIYGIPSISQSRAVDLYSETTYEGAWIAWNEIQKENNKSTQEFYFQYIGNGQYYIINIASGKYVTIRNQGGKNWGAIYSKNDSDVQKWYVQRESDGYTICSVQNRNLAMTGVSYASGEGYNYWIEMLSRDTANKNQLFDLKPLTTQSISDTKATIAKANNRRKYIKLSGYVWEDISWNSGKVFDSNGLYQAINDDKNDKLLENINVKLKDSQGNTISFKDISGNTVNEVLTDTNGKYTMVDVLIDNLDNYYIEFSYNGMAYESVQIIDINNVRGTDAIEGDNRPNFDENFAQITVGQSNNKEGQKVNEIKYNQGNYSSTINYEGNYLYGYRDEIVEEIQPYTGLTLQEYKAYYPVNGVADKYMISSTTYNAYKSVGKSGYLSDIITAESIRDNGTEEIGATFDDGINLGIKKRERPDLSVVKDLDRATINVVGTQHVYLYGDRFNEELWADNSNGLSGHEIEPAVKFEEKYAQMTYSRPLYASDVYYNGDINERLEVKVTYKIGVRNNSTTLGAEIYELDDYFDTKYNLIAVGTDINSDGSIKAGTEITDNTEITQFNEDYKKITIGQSNKAIVEMGSLEEKYIYLQFSVDREDIIEIIETENNEYTKLDNISEIKRYGITRENSEGEKSIYAGIDKDSQPGSTNPSDRSTYEDDTDKAPGLLITFEEERQVKGNVFMDTDENASDVDKDIEVHTGIARQGNGQYDNDEQGVENVKVTLMDENDNVVQVYNEESEKFEEAVTYTDENGEYTFGGFLPGQYYIKYTWGGNIDGEGNNSTYKLENGEKEVVNVQNYKSTIVDETVWNKKGEEAVTKWYTDEFKQGYKGIEWNSELNTEIRTSDAVDDYETRLKIDEETSEITYSETQKFENTYNENSTEEKYENTQMDSRTQAFTVYLEYNDTEDILNNITDRGFTLKNVLSSIDFGITERSKQVLELEKNIKAVKVTLANGNILINARLNENGELEDYTKYVTVIPKSPAANGQINIQVDEELLQSATVEIEYGLEVINISELDYQTEEFYKYGVGHGEVASEIVTLRPALIIDYLNENLVLDINYDDIWDAISKENRKDQLINSGLLSSDLEDVLLETERVETTDELQDEILVPEGVEIENINSKSSVTVGLKSYRLLSGNGEETYTENNAEIIKVIKDKGGALLSTIPGNYNLNDLSTSEVDDARSQSVVIIPPTGLTTNYVAYILLAVSSLGILVAGIILIRKFVIK